jgi:hypothetical protein
MVSKDMQLQLLLAKVEPILTHDPNQLKVLMSALIQYLEHTRTEEMRR